MFVREERPQSDPGKGYYWTLNTAMGEGNNRDRKRKREGQNIKEEEEEDTDFSSDSQLYPTSSPSVSSRRPLPRHNPDNTQQTMHANHQQSMMHVQMQYAVPAVTSNPTLVSQPVWGPQVGMLGMLGPGIIAEDQYHNHHQDVSSSHRRIPTSVVSARSQEQAGLPSHTMKPMQGPFMPSMRGVSHPSTRSSRHRHSDTSPKAHEYKRARSGLGQHSGNES
jgi:hypothetical protein